jgi:hypothetical protein
MPLVELDMPLLEFETPLLPDAAALSPLSPRAAGSRSAGAFCGEVARFAWSVPGSADVSFRVDEVAPVEWLVSDEEYVPVDPFASWVIALSASAAPVKPAPTMPASAIVNALREKLMSAPVRWMMIARTFVDEHQRPLCERGREASVRRVHEPL